MAWLVLSHAQQPFVSGFWIPFALDSTEVLCTFGYFASCGIRGARAADPPVVRSEAIADVM